MGDRDLVGGAFGVGHKLVVRLPAHLKGPRRDPDQSRRGQALHGSSIHLPSCTFAGAASAYSFQPAVSPPSMAMFWPVM